MKKLILLFLGLLLFANIHAQSDAKAIELLDKLADNSKTYDNLHLKYYIVVEDTQGASADTMPGELWYFNGKYKIEMIGQVVFSDGETSWTYLEEIEEVNVTDAPDENEEDILDPRKLLKDYKNLYKCRLISDKFIHNRPLVEIDLFPVDIESKDYSRITLVIDKTELELYSVRYVGKDGVSYFVKFMEYNTKAKITEDDVTFKEQDFPNADLIDMR